MKLNVIKIPNKHHLTINKKKNHYWKNFAFHQLFFGPFTRWSFLNQFLYLFHFCFHHSSTGRRPFLSFGGGGRRGVKSRMSLYGIGSGNGSKWTGVINSKVRWVSIGPHAFLLQLEMAFSMDGGVHSYSFGSGFTGWVPSHNARQTANSPLTPAFLQHSVEWGIEWMEKMPDLYISFNWPRLSLCAA